MHVHRPTHTEDGEYIFSVSELNATAKTVLEGHFRSVLVTGEISNFSRPASGHIYFSIQDEQAGVRCAWFRRDQIPLSFKIENGIHVILLAHVTLYVEKGEYQLLVRKIHLAGEGMLQQRLEALKRKLLAEGLFDPAHKKSIPAFPRAVDVITSGTGAALQDILIVLKRRAPFIPVFVYPCQVQGQGARESIMCALSRAIKEQLVDVLLLARGGGSHEDLSVFNQEALAYAIFASPIPIVSAIGHEIDLSIADYVADCRAPTPSAAAELCSPNSEELLAFLEDCKSRILKNAKASYQEKAQKLYFYKRLMVHPAQKINREVHFLQNLSHDLYKIIHNQFERKKMRLSHLSWRMNKNTPYQKIIIHKRALSDLQEALLEAIQKKISYQKTTLSILFQKINTLNPDNTLKRGYAILYTEKNTVLSDAKNVQVGERIRAHLAQGKLICQVQKRGK